MTLVGMGLILPKFRRLKSGYVQKGHSGSGKRSQSHFLLDLVQDIDVICMYQDTRNKE